MHELNWTLRRSALLCLACCSLIFSASGRASADTHAFYAAAIWSGQGQAIENGVMVVTDGKISEVGVRGKVKVPAAAVTHELGEVTLMPGLVIAQTSMGGSFGSDPYSISPEVQAVDGFDPFDDYDSLLAAGITCVQVSPSGSKLVAGQGGVVRLGATPGEHVVSDTDSLLINLNANEFRPASIYEPPVGAVSVDRPLEPTRPQLATSLSQARVGLEALFAEAAVSADSEDVSLSALAGLLGDGTPVRWDVRNNAESTTALALSKQFKLSWILVDPAEVDAIAKPAICQSPQMRGIIVNPELSPGRINNPAVPREGSKKPTPVWGRVKQLIDAGAGERIALHAASDSELEQLLFTSSILGRGGITKTQILSMLTANPARILGVEKQVGSLQPGCFADFVVMSGTDMNGRVLATYSGGNSVYEREEEDTLKTTPSYTIHAASVYTPNGIVENASVGVADGKISGIGSEISSRPDAIIKDYSGAVIVPGMFDCGVSVGTGGTAPSVTLGSKIETYLARDDRQVALARQGGVTTALLSSSRVPGPVMAFKLTDQPRVLKDPVALRFTIRGNLTAAEESFRKTLTSGKAYADAWTAYDAKYAEYQKELKVYEEAKKKYDAAKKAAEEKKKAEEAKKKAEEAKKAAASKSGTPAPEKKESGDKPTPKPAPTPSPKPEVKKEATPEKKDAGTDKKEPAKDEKAKEGEAEKAAPELKEPKKPTAPKKPRASATMEPYRALFAGKLAALVEISDSKAADVVVKLFRKEFKLKTAVVASSVAAEKSILLRDNDVFVVVGPGLVGTSEGKLVNYPAELAVAGVPFGFQSRANTGVQELPNAISYAVFQGLGRGDALQALTTSPIEFFGLEKIGSLAEGNDADLVVLSGSPLELSTEVLAVMIDGKWVYEKEQ